MEGMLVGADQRPSQVVEAWLDRFNAALDARDAARLGALFRPDGHWRDIAGLGRKIATVSGRDHIAAALASAVVGCGARNFAVDPDRLPPRATQCAGEEAIEAILRFETAAGGGAAHVRFEAADAAAGGISPAWTLLTALSSLAGHDEESVRLEREEPAFERDWRGPNWLDRRREAARRADDDAAVLIVGGGHAGLTAAAWLKGARGGGAGRGPDGTRRRQLAAALPWAEAAQPSAQQPHALPAVPEDLAQLHSEGQDRQLARILRRGHGDRRLDADGFRGRQLRLRRARLDGAAPLGRRQPAGDAPAAHRHGHQRQRHPEHPRHPDTGPFRRHGDALQPLQGRRGVAGQGRVRGRHRHQRPTTSPRICTATARA